MRDLLEHIDVQGKLVTRTLVAREVDAEAVDFPFVAQAARVHRQTGQSSSEVVELLTSRPAAQLSPKQWLAANIHHWAIENGLHGRLDASRHDDTCRLRRPKAVLIHGRFNRWANSRLIPWRTRPIRPPPISPPAWLRTTIAGPSPPSSRVLSLREYALGGDQRTLYEIAIPSFFSIEERTMTVS